jgi:hypothetical protein
MRKNPSGITQSHKAAKKRNNQSLVFDLNLSAFASWREKKEF